MKKHCMQCGRAVVRTPSQFLARTFCGSDCFNIYRKNQPSEFEQFLARMKGVKACWNWTKGMDKEGRSHVHADGKNRVAARHAFALLVTKPPNHLFVLHSCDNPTCVNPNHLRLGTQKDNYADARSRNRASIGERNGCRKVTAQDVKAIRSDARRQVDIAADYGIGQTAVSMIVTRNNWKHVK